MDLARYSTHPAINRRWLSPLTALPARNAAAGAPAQVAALLAAGQLAVLTAAATLLRRCQPGVRRWTLPLGPPQKWGSSTGGRKDAPDPARPVAGQRPRRRRRSSRR